MNDRELLEFAAKAASIELGDKDFTDEIGRKWSEALGLWIKFVPGVDSGCWWNPLADDGDALRLAVKLEIDLWFGCGGLSAHGLAMDIEEDYGRDSCAATRRAIVRAAAEIGKAMP